LQRRNISIGLAAICQCKTGKEVSYMSMLHKFEPRKRVIDVKRTAPLTHSMEEFFEDFPPRHTVKVA
jgi:hypothetical protein